MKKYLAVMLVVAMSTAACAKPAHEAYIDEYGHGGVAIMQVSDGSDYPPLKEFDRDRFEYEGGAFQIDARAMFSFRFFFKDGKTARELVDEFGSPYTHYQVVYWSDAQPEAAGKAWPSSPLEVPNWEPLFGSFTKLDETFLGWRSMGLSWNDDVTQTIKTWVSEKSKPGDRMYIAIRFRNAAAHDQGRYWNQATSRWVTPTLISFSKPFAAGTLVFR